MFFCVPNRKCGLDSQADRAEKSENSAETNRLRKLSKNTGVAAVSRTGAALGVAGLGVAVGLPTGGAETVLNDGSLFLIHHGFYKIQ